MKSLSDLPENKQFPAYCSSMAGGNMISQKNPHFSGQGSDSEATHDVVEHNMTDFGNEQIVPVLPGEETPGEDLDVFEKGTSYTPTDRTWKDLS